MKHKYMFKTFFANLNSNSIQKQIMKFMKFMNSELPDWPKPNPNDIDILEQESP